MGGFSLWHILIVAIIILMLFGGNRFSAMMGDIAKGLKSFKTGMANDNDPPHTEAHQRPVDPRLIQPQQPIDIMSRAPRTADTAAPVPPPADTAH